MSPFADVIEFVKIRQNPTRNDEAGNDSQHKTFGCDGLRGFRCSKAYIRIIVDKTLFTICKHFCCLYFVECL